MAKKNAVEAEPEVAEQPTGTLRQPNKFTISRLRQDCITLFDITTSAFDGATYGLEGEYTVDDMRSHIDRWLRKPIKKEATK